MRVGVVLVFLLLAQHAWSAEGRLPSDIARTKVERLALKTVSALERRDFKALASLMDREGTLQLDTCPSAEGSAGDAPSLGAAQVAGLGSSREKHAFGSSCEVPDTVQLTVAEYLDRYIPAGHVGRGARMGFNQ